MKVWPIFYVTTSWSGYIFAASRRSAVTKRKSDVSIWNLETELRESEFPTIMDSHGFRLAINAEGTFCVAGAFDLDGVACYRAKTGEEVWRREDIKKVQCIDVLPSGSEVFCAIEEGPSCVLNLHDGRTVRKIHNCRNLWRSSFEGIQLIEPADKNAELEVQAPDGSTLSGIDRETFGVLSALFAQDSLVISEAGGPLRCFEPRTGSVLWRYGGPAGSHCLEVGYHSELRRFLAVEYPYETGGNTSLLLFSNSGKVEAKFPLGAAFVTAFCLAGTHLLSSEGWLIETATGRLSKSFDFPMKEYSNQG